MQRIGIVVALFSGLLATAASAVDVRSAASAQAEGIRLHATATRRVNAVYHAACLAESLACTRDVFENFWKTKLNWQEADAAAISGWRLIMKAVSDRAPAQPVAPMFLNAPQFHPAQSAREAILVAALEARTAPEFRQRTRGRLSLSQADRLWSTIDYVQGRVAPLWPPDLNSLDARMRAVESAAAKTDMPGLVAEMAGFLEAQLPRPDIYVDGIIAPDPKSSSYGATQIGGHLLVELVDAMPAEDIVSGALHELTHYIYNLGPPAKHFALVDYFVQRGGPSAVGLYTYLNEAIASATQGVHTGRLREPQQEDKQYAHPYIAPLSSATVPLLDAALRRRETLFSGFAARYIEGGIAALEGKVTDPRFVLAQAAAIVSNEDDQRLASSYFSTMFPHASARQPDESLVAPYPELSVVRFVRYDALDAVRLPAHADLLKLRKHRAFCYATRRGQVSWRVILAGRDVAAIDAAIARLGELSKWPGEGVLFTID